MTRTSKCSEHHAGEAVRQQRSAPLVLNVVGTVASVAQTLIGGMLGIVAATIIFPLRLPRQ